MRQDKRKESDLDVTARLLPVMLTMIHIRFAVLGASGIVATVEARLQSKVVTVSVHRGHGGRRRDYTSRLRIILGGRLDSGKGRRRRSNGRRL